MTFEHFSRPLIFVAHPDDETLSCGGLIQRMANSLVVFATDAAPLGYGMENKFGTLQDYSEKRFQEASRALGHVPSCAFERLTKSNGAYFADQHLFQDLREAAASLVAITRSFLPDAIVSHAYEGGHIDHDACSFLAAHAAKTVSARHFEFPLYWINRNGQDVFQTFREAIGGVIELELSEVERKVKQKMFAEYETQQEIMKVFSIRVERFRASMGQDFSKPACRNYPFENRRIRLGSRKLLRKFKEFETVFLPKSKKTNIATRIWRMSRHS